ncbi:MAG: NUDIX hydrolase [bacterium]|nr:MAG: NUDIX hydrolase [bacterium]
MSEGFVYCPLCSHALERIPDEGQARMKCPACGFIHYRNPAPAVGVIMLDGARVLLVKRRFDPYKGKWAIPSGFIEYNEDVRETAVREVREETGLEIEIVALHAVESCFDDPRGNTLLVLYTGRITGGALRAGDDAADVGYFPLDALPEIAFEAHRRVLGDLARSL